VSEDLRRPGGLQQGPEQGHESPHPVRREAVQQTYPAFTPRRPGHGPSLSRSARLHESNVEYPRLSCPYRHTVMTGGGGGAQGPTGEYDPGRWSARVSP
jgi:hypothetical protein